MLGKILLVKGFHVIFTTYHDCVLHIRAPRSLQCPRTTTGTPVSPSVAVHFNFRGYLQFLCVCHSYFTVEKTDLHSPTDIERREVCSKNRTVDAGTYLVQ
jgi:hypothetical protein